MWCCHTLVILLVTVAECAFIPPQPGVACSHARACSGMPVQMRALELLKAKLVVIQQEQQAKEIAEIRGNAVKAEWGQQIRNYVFHPYKLVKDVRTGEETSDVGAVMDGDLDAFMQAYLRHKGARRTEDV